MEQRTCNIEGLKSLLTIGGIIEPLTVIEGGEIKGDLEGIHFKKAVFEKHIVLNGSISNDQITFEGCQFMEGISFLNISFSLGILLKNCNCTNLKFISCAFDELLIDGGAYTSIEFRNIVKESASGSNEIKINNINCNQLLTKAKDVSSAFSISRSTFENVTFQNTHIRGAIHVTDDTKIKSFEAQSCTFYNRLDFGKCEFTTHVWIHKCSFEEQVIFTKNFKCNMLTLANVLGKQNISLDYASNVGSLDISDSSFNFNCGLTPEHIPDESLSCNIYGVINGNLVFTDVPIWSISIGAINFGNIILDNISTKLIFFKNFHNRNRLSMSNLRLNENYNVVVISDSNINQTEFTNVDFSKFTEVVIAKSEVSNMILSNSRLPKKLQIETVEPKLGYLIPKSERSNINLYLKEAYRQLKIVMEKHGNRKEALHFQSMEMYYLRHELPFGWDKLLLFLNYISNDHGASWVRGVVFTITASFVFFCLYNEASSNPFFYWNPNASLEDIRLGFRSGLDGFTSYWTTFPALDPGHSSSSGWQLNLIIFLSRVFIGYGIYQTITAFRKFAR